MDTLVLAVRTHLILLLQRLVISKALLSFLYDAIHCPLTRTVIIGCSKRQQQLDYVSVLLCSSCMNGLLPPLVLCIGVCTSLQTSAFFQHKQPQVQT